MNWKLRGNLDRGAASDLWRHTLSQIPCLFGRLVYLSSLRNINTGKYEHHGLSMMFGEEQADGALRDSHERTFADWIGYSLEQQKADLDLYLTTLSSDKRTTVDTWLRLAPYRNMLPSRTTPPQRKLYLADLEALLRLLKNELGVDAPDPGA